MGKGSDYLQALVIPLEHRVLILNIPRRGYIIVTETSSLQQVVIRGVHLTRSNRSIPNFSIEEIEVSRAILGCDCFISWVVHGGESPFKNSQGNINALKVLDVMKTSVDSGVTGIDLSPPLIEVFRKLQAISTEKVVGLGALQEWTCKNFTIDGVPLESYGEEIKATVSSRLPKQYLRGLIRSKSPETGFIKSFFVPKYRVQPLTQHQIDSIRIEPQFFEKRLELYRQLGLKLVQFGGGTADWLIALGRTDLLEYLTRLIKKAGFKPILICHWASMIIPVVEEELELAGYIIPLNKLWGLLTLHDTIETIKNVEKPIIAMKVLAHGVLASDLHDAFTFVFKRVKIEAVLVGISSKLEAEQTFSTIARVLGR